MSINRRICSKCCQSKNRTLEFLICLGQGPELPCQKTWHLWVSWHQQASWYQWTSRHWRPSWHQCADDLASAELLASPKDLVSADDLVLDYLTATGLYFIYLSKSIITRFSHQTTFLFIYIYHDIYCRKLPSFENSNSWWRGCLKKFWHPTEMAKARPSRENITQIVGNVHKLSGVPKFCLMIITEIIHVLFWIFVILTPGLIAIFSSFILFQGPSTVMLYFTTVGGWNQSYTEVRPLA